MAYVADRMRVVIARSRYGWRVVIESQATIDSDAENSNLQPASRDPLSDTSAKLQDYSDATAPKMLNFGLYLLQMLSLV